MKDKELVKALREHAEWQRGNEWETPITLGDDLVEAADRIANQNTHILALQKEIEDLRAQLPRWIPVTERLPDDPVKKVLIFVPHTHGNIVDVGRYLGADGWVLEGWYLTQTSVTHWMPLPEPPKEDKQWKD